MNDKQIFDLNLSVIDSNLTEKAENDTVNITTVFHYHQLWKLANPNVTLMFLLPTQRKNFQDIKESVGHIVVSLAKQLAEINYSDSFFQWI